jgi:CheY-like chemotaxis protein
MRIKTVLLVEDNEDNRIVYATILQHHGYAVLEAGDGETGVRLARERKPDAILMDISLPIYDGWHATTLLKGDAETAHIPIVALTAHALTMDRERAREVGCDGYLTKPCDPSRVLAELKRLIGPPTVRAS